MARKPKKPPVQKEGWGKDGDKTVSFSIDPLSSGLSPEVISRPISFTRAVLFDLDGTFADTAPDLAAALNHTRATRDLPPLSVEVLRPHASDGSRGLLKIGLDIDPGHPDYDALREMFLDFYESNICVHTQLCDDMAELVAQLERHDIKWGIVTNKPHRFTVPLMQALGYAERAACLISGDTCMRAKPYPDPLLKA